MIQHSFSLGTICQLQNPPAGHKLVFYFFDFRLQVARGAEHYERVRADWFVYEGRQRLAELMTLLFSESLIHDKDFIKRHTVLDHNTDSHEYINDFAHVNCHQTFRRRATVRRLYSQFAE